MILEVCAFNIQSCFVAEKAGASRIEFCADPLQGGTTPSLGALEYVLQNITISVFPMVRPRGGDFHYDIHDLEIIKRDIIACRNMGFKGIATGILRADNTIDTDSLKRIVEWAYPMQVTCHKAFDAVPDAFTALEEVIAAGCARILTSGLHKTAMEGVDVLAKLVKQADGRIIIMPGGSIRSSNIRELILKTGAVEYHSSGLTAKNEGFIADEHEVYQLSQAANQ